jgi:hypothetical protein
MVADFVSLRSLAPNDVRLLFRTLSDYKERQFDSRFRDNVEQLGRIRPVRPIIECKRRKLHTGIALTKVCDRLHYNPMLALLTVVVSFVLTGLVGNWLVQRWQQRNWLTQHSLQRAEKQIEQLRALIDEILRLGDARNYRTRRVVLQLNSEDSAKFERTKEDYDQAVVNWNDRFNSMCVGLTMYAAYQPYTERLEGIIQPLFVSVSEKVEVAIGMRANGPVPRSLIAQRNVDLNEISGMLFEFGRDLVRLLLNKQQEAYEGELIFFSKANLGLFPTWYLLKALFQPTYPFQAVSSTALNLSHPFVTRSRRSGVY